MRCFDYAGCISADQTIGGPGGAASLDTGSLREEFSPPASLECAEKNADNISGAKYSLEFAVLRVLSPNAYRQECLFYPPLLHDRSRPGCKIAADTRD